MKDNSGLLYLACPYAHSDPAIREHRFQQANRAAAKLMQANIVVFSPLSHSVPIAEYLGDTSHEFWMLQDLELLKRSDELLILGLENWEKSLGVREEMFTALRLRKPITLIDEPDIELLPYIPNTARKFLQSSIFTEKVSS